MNKEELIELLESLELDVNEYWVLSTSALVLREICEYTDDLDIAVTESGFEKLQNNYDLIELGCGWYRVTDMIECVIDDDLESKSERHEIYNLEDIEIYYEYLLKSNKDEDMEKLKIVEEYLKNRA